MQLYHNAAMSLPKLEQKVQAYSEAGYVKLNESSFGRLCKLARKAVTAAVVDSNMDSTEASNLEASICSRLFTMIAWSGASSGATALFRSAQPILNLSDVSAADVDWYARHPWRRCLRPEPSVCPPQ